MKKLIFPLIAMVVLLIGCKDDDTMTADTYTIHFHSPDDADKHNGDTIHIHTDFTSEGTIHMVKIELENTTAGTTDQIIEEHAHETDGSYSYHGDYILNVTTHTDMVLRAKTWAHGEDESTATVKELMFHVHPM